jgi:hypothetical protein
MKLKDKPGIETWDKIAVCKVTGDEITYLEGQFLNLKQFLTRRSIKFDVPLEPTLHFEIIDNPYKDTPRCNCKICSKVFKDPTNKSGMLTTHILNKHNVEIKDYIAQYPTEEHLFSNYKLKQNKIDGEGYEGENGIQCPICKKWFKAIKATHTALHGMTPTEFKKFTGMESLLSEKSKEKAKEVYYIEGGLCAYKKPRTKPEKVKKELNKFSRKREIKMFMAGVDYHTYDYETIRKEGAHFIYKITSPSGKCYIGRTSEFYGRMRRHEEVSKDSATTGLYYAVKKYGWESMVVEIIDIAVDKKEAIKKELEWITFFDSYRHGYNRTLKTEGGGCPIDPSDTEAYAEYIQRMSDRMKGQPAPNKGIPMTEEAKQKMKEKAKGRFSLEWFIERYGIEKGTQMYDDRGESARSRAMGNDGKFGSKAS